jgi:putative protease
MELLAPAGGMEALRAAVFCGADAVYLGGGGFNARKNARNFTKEELAEAISFCHERGVFVYVTMNTLLADREMEEAADYIRYVNRIGADALIVQDLGVARLARSLAPNLSLHASTQMTVASAEGVRLCKELGFSRVVLARELSKEQVETIVQDGGLETEVFVHGALCVSFSGQCYYSAMIGGRSGNRGLCAQPCRLMYQKEGQAKAPLLSLKDISLGAHLTELAQLGVTSLKIEGRMRRPEYVAAVCTAFRTAIDEKRNLTREELAELATVFSRQGFTDGYFTGDMSQMQGVREGPNEKAYRQKLDKLQKLYARERVFPKIGISMEAELAKNRPALLCISDGTHTVTVTGDTPEQAKGRGLTEEELVKRLTPGKGSPYYVKDMWIMLEPGLFYSAASGNALRRTGLSALSEAVFPHIRPEGTMPNWPKEGKPQKAAISASVRTKEQLSALLKTPPARIYLPFSFEPEKWPKLPEGVEFALTLPRVFEPGMEKAVKRQIKKAKEAGVSALLAGSLGTFSAALEYDMPVYGDAGLNLANSHALWQAQQLGLAGATASFELTLAQIRGLASKLPLEVLAYGRLPLMLLKRCMMKNCKNCTGEMTIFDRRGEPVYITKEYGCQNQLWNGHVLWLQDKLSEWNAGPALLRLVFTDETPARCAEVLQAYQNNDPCPMPEVFTRGLYYRGVQ